MIMVVRYNDTSSVDIDAAMSRIEFFEANMLGFILNDVKKNKKYNKFIEPTRNVAPINKKTDAQIMNKNRQNNSNKNRTSNSNNRPKR